VEIIIVRCLGPARQETGRKVIENVMSDIKRNSGLLGEPMARQALRYQTGQFHVRVHLLSAAGQSEPTVLNIMQECTTSKSVSYQ
jgi:hypothetical protein